MRATGKDLGKKLCHTSQSYFLCPAPSWGALGTQN